ncbi:MAG TPA: hypothetical protein DCG69_02355 [Bacteroidales bacterium]|nr:hypothetical protein [Bacteroidales bacterium]
MKSLKNVLFIIVGTLITLYSYAQELKEEKKVRLKIEVVDEQGNKKIVDTAFVVQPGMDVSKIVNEIKQKSGANAKEIAALKTSFEMEAKHLQVNGKDCSHEEILNENRNQIFVFSDDHFAGTEELKKALEDLKIEISGMKMNVEAMRKLEKAMSELNDLDLKGNSEKMKKFHIEHHNPLMMINENVDSLRKGNTFFFGTDEDLKIIEGIDGEKKIIIKRIPKEAMKGGAIFISDNATEIKEFHDENGNVKVIRYEIKKEENDGKNIEIFLDVDDKTDGKKEIIKHIYVTNSSLEKETEKAKEKGLIAKDSEPLNLKMFNVNSTDEKTTVGTHFENKGKVSVQVLDKEMNKIWEKNAGKISGEYSVEIPSEIIKSTETYYLLFTQDNKSKLFKITGK